MLPCLCSHGLKLSKKNLLKDLVANLVRAAAALYFSVSGAYHVFLLQKIAASYLVELFPAVCAEHHSGENRHLAHWRNRASSVPDALHNVKGLLVDVRLVGILENQPL